VAYDASPVKVAVATTQDLFVRGGATAHGAQLVQALGARGHEVELVQIPFDWTSKVELLRQAYQWRLLDLHDAADLVITLKFPAFYLRAARKVAWILHQHRPLYENFDRPEHSAFSSSHPEDQAIRDAVRGWDTRYLRRFNGLDGEPLYHPPPGADVLHAGSFGDYVLWLGRLQENKRPALLLDALARTRGAVRAVFAGRGPLADDLRATARRLGLDSRVEFRGFVSEEERIALYAGALAVVYAPFDEDLGYVTLEAFLAEKPVITMADSGGPLEFVKDGVNGAVAPDAAGLAAAIDAYAADRTRAAEHGRAGRQQYADLVPSWDTVCEKLLATA
jgi:glycosyltransferase involved in cell wall biosynthesis